MNIKEDFMFTIYCTVHSLSLICVFDVSIVLYPKWGVPYSRKSCLKYYSFMFTIVYLFAIHNIQNFDCFLSLDKVPLVSHDSSNERVI